MRIATLQFAPTLGALEHNISRANALLHASNPSHMDLLVLPELAFSGYNFPSLEAIKPFLEPTTSGTSTKWAIETAQRLNCYVIVGYPEIHTSEDGTVTRYNSTVTVSSEGEVVANYRKSFLYYTDETWASEGHNPSPDSSPSPDQQPPRPFYCAPLGKLLRYPSPSDHHTLEPANVGLGICMDINPHRFTAPWTAFEFANRMLEGKAKLIVLSMAWLTRLSPEELALEPEKPDMETVAYWLERFGPFFTPESMPAGDVTVVFANRCGVEGNVVAKEKAIKQEHDVVGSVEVENGQVQEGDRVCYAGSSCVMRFQNGNVRMFERAKSEMPVMGKGEEGLLVVDTGEPARFLLSRR